MTDTPAVAPPVDLSSGFVAAAYPGEGFKPIMEAKTEPMAGIIGEVPECSRAEEAAARALCRHMGDNEHEAYMEAAGGRMVPRPQWCAYLPHIRTTNAAFFAAGGTNMNSVWGKIVAGLRRGFW